MFLRSFILNLFCKYFRFSPRVSRQLFIVFRSFILSGMLRRFTVKIKALPGWSVFSEFTGSDVFRTPAPAFCRKFLRRNILFFCRESRELTAGFVGWFWRNQNLVRLDLVLVVSGTSCVYNAEFKKFKSWLKWTVCIYFYFIRGSAPVLSEPRTNRSSERTCKKSRSFGSTVSCSLCPFDWQSVHEANTGLFTVNKVFILPGSGRASASGAILFVFVCFVISVFTVFLVYIFSRSTPHSDTNQNTNDPADETLHSL